MKKFIPLLLFALAFLSCGERSTENTSPEGKPIVKKLPYLGTPMVEYRMENGISIADTVQHTIPPFSFIDQDGQTVTEKTVEGKIYVADFIFTTCPSICPVMTKNLKKVQDVFGENENVMILSHSIDPEYDQPAVLKKYAEEKGADTRFWKFLTGDRDTIYEICEKSYMAFAKTDKEAPGGYIHSGFFVLIDKDRHIRGAYDGTEEGKTEMLIEDIKILLQEK